MPHADRRALKVYKKHTIYLKNANLFSLIEHSIRVVTSAYDIPVGVFFHEIAITFARLEGAFETHSVGRFHDTGPVFLALTEVPPELGAVLLSEDALAVHHAISPRTVVNISVRPGVFAAAVFLVILPLADV